MYSCFLTAELSLSRGGPTSAQDVSEREQLDNHRSRKAERALALPRTPQPHQLLPPCGPHAIHTCKARAPVPLPVGNRHELVAHAAQMTPFQMCTAESTLRPHPAPCCSERRRVEHSASQGMQESGDRSYSDDCCDCCAGRKFGVTRRQTGKDRGTGLWRSYRK